MPTEVTTKLTMPTEATTKQTMPTEATTNSSSTEVTSQTNSVAVTPGKEETSHYEDRNKRRRATFPSAANVDGHIVHRSRG